jgi:hypothetical protein
MSKEKVALQEMVQDYGWEIFSDYIKTQREKAIGCLCGAQEWTDVVRQQERVRIYDYILKQPHEMIRSEK